jgi:acyl carrier protein
MGIEEAFDIEIENEDAEKIVTVGDAVEQIKNAVN